MPPFEILPLVVAAIAVLAIVGVAWWLIQRHRTIPPPLPNAAPTDRRRRPRSVGELRPSDQPALYSTDATAAAVEQCYKLAFSANRIDYLIIGEHARVLDEVSKGFAATIQQRDYFPRRPMLLPRLLQAINDTESTRQQLVNLLLEDPAVAGAVLQRANSAFYRVSNTRIERLDRAVIMLGATGLRGLMATAIMQPVFRVPKGYFDAFGEVIWEFARRSSQAAEACARADRTLDPFVSQMLGLLGGLSLHRAVPAHHGKVSRTAERAAAPRSVHHGNAAASDRSCLHDRAQLGTIRHLAAGGRAASTTDSSRGDEPLGTGHVLRRAVRRARPAAFARQLCPGSRTTPAR